MYRQILEDSQDCELQRILYRANLSKQLKEYNLLTLTYGTKSASFLAIRCLVEIVNDIRISSSKHVILENLYVDDLLSGGDSEAECIELYHQLQMALDAVGFPLRKWRSNSATILSHIPNSFEDPNF